ncbi:hypothetical protein [Chryseobacterium sp. ERMR1:04]|uniref:bacteriocin-like protein n=1 Tax=Chryseobacterium sp. ERMR1:04 TaxID=1705393 RepID=UPI0006C8B9B0|nr:hypothetical protein [Chryseobacterium sp. ERMR1:04]KPH14802.1 hypothetical protein AMQ68_05025 [Chryseobacterium sp. ERMR1:04]
MKNFKKISRNEMKSISAGVQTSFFLNTYNYDCMHQSWNNLDYQTIINGSAPVNIQGHVDVGPIKTDFTWFCQDS